MSIIGSRDQMCVNGQFNGHRGTALNSLCKKSRELPSSDPGHCTFFKNTGESVGAGAHADWGLQDIEDLHAFGIQHKLCPYYL